VIDATTSDIIWGFLANIAFSGQVVSILIVSVNIIGVIFACIYFCCSPICDYGGAIVKKESILDYGQYDACIISQPWAPIVGATISGDFEHGENMVFR